MDFSLIENQPDQPNGFGSTGIVVGVVVAIIIVVVGVIIGYVVIRRKRQASKQGAFLPVTVAGYTRHSHPNLVQTKPPMCSSSHKEAFNNRVSIFGITYLCHSYCI